MVAQNETQELFSWSAICQKYPNVWVMVGYPAQEAKKPWDTGKGQVLYFGDDDKEFTSYSAQQILAYKAQKAFAEYYTNYTGKLPTAERLKVIPLQRHNILEIKFIYSLFVPHSF